MFTQNREIFTHALGWEQLRAPSEDLLQPSIINLAKIRDSVVVLTGPNSCGKTTMIETFRSRGLEVLPEFLRDGYEAGKAEFGNYKISRMCSDIIVESSLARHVRMLADVSTNAHDAPQIICDRGIGDYIGFLRLIQALVHPAVTKSPLKNIVKDPDIREVLKEDIDFKEIQESCKRQIQSAQQWSQYIRYRAVLTLRPLPFFEDDGLRSTDAMTTNALAFFVAKSWRELGYKPIFIDPHVNDLERRADYILEAGFGGKFSLTP